MQIETCSTPDRGYMGDRKRGASMGRGNRDAETLRKNAREEVERLERQLEAYQSGGDSHMYGREGAPFKDLAAALARYESLLAPARAELESLEAAAGDTRFHLRKVRLDSGGYDQGGAYWGHGGELFEAWNGAGDFMTVRVYSDDRSAAFKARGGVPIGEPDWEAFRNWHRDGSREAAKDAVREDYPDAIFFR